VIELPKDITFNMTLEEAWGSSQWSGELPASSKLSPVPSFSRTLDDNDAKLSPSTSKSTFLEDCQKLRLLILRALEKPQELQSR
ncbi:unnamed protein product, partial [Polarella glacialis]